MAASPLAGRLLDAGVLGAGRAAAAFGLSGCLMFLLSSAGPHPLALPVNVVAATALALPAHLHLTRASAAAVRGLPGAGFGLFSCACTAGILTGAVAGAALVSRADWVPAWAWAKALGSAGAALALWPVLGQCQGRGREAYAPPGRPGRGAPAGMAGLAAAAAAFSFARTAVLLSVNFRLFRAYGGSVVPYSLACNLAAATAFATFPLYGRLCDAAGPRRFLATALLANAPYLALFFLVDSGEALTALWMLPMSAAVEVGQLAVAAASAPEERRASALGLLGGASSVGTLAGTLLLARGPAALPAPALAALGGVVPVLCLPLLRARTSHRPSPRNPRPVSAGEPPGRAGRRSVESSGRR